MANTSAAKHKTSDRDDRMNNIQKGEKKKNKNAEMFGIHFQNGFLSHALSTDYT